MLFQSQGNVILAAELASCRIICTMTKTPTSAARSHGNAAQVYQHHSAATSLVTRSVTSAAGNLCLATHLTSFQDAASIHAPAQYNAPLVRGAWMLVSFIPGTIDQELPASRGYILRGHDFRAHEGQ